jgi:hypothetical protein
MATARLPLAIALALLLPACATSRDWRTWTEHPTHFASEGHLAFSLRHGNGSGLEPTPAVLARAESERWWGRLVPPPPPPDLSGRWTGRWAGHGLFDLRESRVVVELRQQGHRGTGRLSLADTLAVEAVPLVLRLAGDEGVPVTAEVEEGRLTLRHASPDGAFVAVLAVDGERLVGGFQPAARPLTLTLARGR